MIYSEEVNYFRHKNSFSPQLAADFMVVKIRLGGRVTWKLNLFFVMRSCLKFCGGSELCDISCSTGEKLQQKLPGAQFDLYVAVFSAAGLLPGTRQTDGVLCNVSERPKAAERSPPLQRGCTLRLKFFLTTTIIFSPPSLCCIPHKLSRDHLIANLVRFRTNGSVRVSC